MSKIARYAVSFGLAGCYMPDNQIGPLQFSTRRELAAFIRSEIADAEWPSNVFKDVKIRNLWRHIARWGSSSAHFSIVHKGYSLSFYGLTAEEFNAMNKAEG
jgi:hypothetical protein